MFIFVYQHIRYDDDGDDDVDNVDDEDEDEYFELFDEIHKEKERREERKAYYTDKRGIKEKERVKVDENSEIVDRNDGVDNASPLQKFVAGIPANSRGRQRVSSLNESQQQALIMCLTDIERKHERNGGVSLVQGPPGCGKTHFLVALMHVLLSRGHKLMV